MSCAMVSFSGGGLKFWLEAYSTSTQTNVSFTPIVADANVSAVIKPKGTGALLASIPDGTTVGGNARGQYAVDLQMIRSAATQVASADYTTILGGRNNTNRSSDSVLVGGNGNIIWNHRFNGHGVIVGGQNNSIGNADSSTDGWNFIGGGINNSALALDSCVIVGGNGNTVRGFRSSVVGGASNTLNGNTQSCFIGGGESNTLNSSVAANQKGMVIVGGFSNNNTSQYGFIGAGQTNSNTSNQWSSIVGGLSNSITNSYAFIGGGQSNTASASHSFVGGGIYNIASGDRSVIVGGGSTSVVGDGNRATGTLSFVGGGIKNTASGLASVVVGGGISIGGNTASGNYSFIGAGTALTASGLYSVVVGGNDNNTAGNNSVICGGETNRINKPEVNSGNWCFLGSGQNNDITGPYSNHSVLVGGFDNTVGNGYGMALVGGRENSINGSFSFVGGGQSNAIGSFPSYAAIPGGQTNTISANGSHANIGGGQSNTASQKWAHVGGGQSNTASGEHAFVGGGNQNSASTRSAVGGGQQNSASPELAFIGAGYLNSITAGNHYSFIGSGRQNQGRAQFTVIGGGDNNYNGGYCGAICGGLENRVSASYATVPGGYRGNAELYGQLAHASGRFGRNGDAQAHELIWRLSVTGTAQTELFLDGASVAAVIPWSDQPNPATVWHGTIDIASMCVATGNGTTVFGDVAATSYKVTIKRYGHPTWNTVLVGTVQEIGTLNADTSMAAVAFSIDNNDTNESLRIRFTPPPTAGSTTVIYTVATFRGLQILY